MLLCLRHFALGVILVISAALLSAVFSGTAVVQNTSLEGTKTIVFVCLHGSVNSQMAAAYFNKAAQERGLPYTAISRGIDLHRSIPVRILDGLALDGLAPVNSPHERCRLTLSEQAKCSRSMRYQSNSEATQT
jgi:hypothetical protein